MVSTRRLALDRLSVVRERGEPATGPLDRMLLATVAFEEAMADSPATRS